MIAFGAIVAVIAAIGALPIATPWKTLILIGALGIVVYLLRRGTQEILIDQPGRDI